VPNPRRHSRRAAVGRVPVGGDAPISVQSMTTTDTRDPQATLVQIARLEQAGCDIVRVAIPHRDALPGFQAIVAESPLPVVADVHFDHTIAIDAARMGAAKLRINPGNIGDMARVDAVIEAAGEVGIPIRIGVNAGSLAAEFAERDWPLAAKLAASAVSFCSHFESRGFTDIVVSAKASSVAETVDAYRRLAAEIDYPLHIGVTEAGTLLSGTVKSSVGLGILLAEGIGDTLRVSLTADPVEEVGVGWEILSALDIRRRGPELVSCPTCGRCQVDLIGIANEVASHLTSRTAPIKVAVMGCEVNGPGEARDADIGVACGKGVGLLFARGEALRKVSEAEIIDALFAEIDRLEDSQG
jgi:(E)-4-hydroxy-3-methylbut-2-enyl-diphosphate synthase